MPLKLKKQRNGVTLRPFWYGEYTVDGKSEVVNLGEFDGIPPASGKVSDSGNEAFEQSRVKAEAKLRKRAAEAHRKGRAEHLTERLIESKTGRAVEYVRIEDMAMRWREIERDKPATEKHLGCCDKVFAMFADFMRKQHPGAVHLYEITNRDAAAWTRHLRERYSSKTVSEYRQLIRSAVVRLLPSGYEVPFAEIARNGKTSGDTIHRRPFTADELKQLLDTARPDGFLYPLVTTAACTGLRRGDVCGLRWGSIDLTAGMLTVKTSKTGAPVEMPIFPPLREVLESRKTGCAGDYVFPDAARMLAENPDGLTWRFKKLVATALAGEPVPTLEAVDAADIAQEAVDAIERNATEGDRRNRIIDTFKRYADGQSVRMIERDAGVSRGVISSDLAAVEKWTGKTFVRRGRGRQNKGERSRAMRNAIDGATRQGRENGMRAGSVRDWHALRATWVTLALAAGVPMELVRRVTGHATVEVVLQHYFRPGRDQFKAILTDAMPEVLTGGKAAKVKPAEELAALAGKLAAGTATDADKERLRLLVADV